MVVPEYKDTPNVKVRPTVAEFISRNQSIKDKAVELLQEKGYDPLVELG